MRYLLLMTFAGSGLFVGYLCWERVFRKYVSSRIRYGASVVVLLSYIAPWAWLKEIYNRIFLTFWFEKRITNVKGTINIADVKTESEAYRAEDYQWLLLFMTIWFTVAFCLVLIKSIRYLRKRRDLRLLAIECDDEKLEETVEFLRKEMHCWRKPKVVWTRVDNETFTLSGIKPIIFLQKEYKSGELYLILKHEMIHIIRLDMLIKLMQEFVCCLHWFNPFVYILVHKMDFICESSCDERVLKGCTDEEREAYAELLDKNKKGNRARKLLGSRLEGNDSEIEKRIELIRETRKVKVQAKVIAVSVFLLLIFIDSLTAFAYPDMQHVKDAETESAKELANGGNLWVYNHTEEGYDISTDLVLYDEQFMSETGDISFADPENPSVSCENHNMESGYYQKHIKQGDNSCTVEIYEGMRCTNCGTVWIGDMCSTTDCNICIH